MTVATASARFWVSVNSVFIAATGLPYPRCPAGSLVCSAILRVRLGLVGALAFDEADRRALHQPWRQPCEQPLAVCAARPDKQRLVAAAGLERVLRQPASGRGAPWALV